jgi:hypothetical protein
MHMDLSTRLLLAALAATIALVSPAQAQIQVTVSPPSIQPGQPVALDLVVGVSGCYDVVTTAVTRSAAQVDVVIDIVPPGPDILCFSPPPPELVGRSELGAFAAGHYSVTVTGTFGGTALQPGTASFVVAGSSAARSIPTTSVWFLVPMALAVLGIGFALNLRDSMQ